jgi:FixJ family two-component response regulator
MSAMAISAGYSVVSQVLGNGFKAAMAVEATPIVFILDEDSATRESVEFLVRGEGWRCETFVSAKEFLARPAPSAANCLIIDADCCSDALEVQRRIASERPGTAVIFMAGNADVATTVKAMKAGAVEFFTKPVAEDNFLASLREGLERSGVALAREKQVRTLRDRYGALSRREREVMWLVVSGLLNKQVGGELGISEITVKAHRGRVMQKMKAASLADLVKISARLRLAPAPKA